MRAALRVTGRVLATVLTVAVVSLVYLIVATRGRLL
ncbi:hypothetical protein SUDANB151_06796 [Streptomyces sp. enrichment culture]